MVVALTVIVVGSIITCWRRLPRTAARFWSDLKGAADIPLTRPFEDAMPGLPWATVWSIFWVNLWVKGLVSVASIPLIYTTKDRNIDE